MSTPEPTAEVTFEEFLNTFTGYEERMIAQEFKVADVLQCGPFEALRVGVFVHHLRKPMKTRNAFKAAMSMTRREITDYWPDVPKKKKGTSESGKGQPLSE